MAATRDFEFPQGEFELWLSFVELIKPNKAGYLVNQIRRLTENIGPLPKVKRSPDPNDDYLMALSEAGQADYLVTGDKSGLLLLRRHKATRIISAAGFASLFARS